MTLKEKLTEINACGPAIKWVGDMDFATAWQTCERGDWMLWLMQKAKLCDMRTLTLAKARCAETVKRLMKDPRSLAALQAAFDFAEGRITEEELEAAAAAAWAAAEAEAAAVARKKHLTLCANLVREVLPNPIFNF